MMTSLRQRLNALGGGAHGTGQTQWIGRLLIAALTLVCIIQGVRLLYILITPIGPVGNWRPQQATSMSTAERAALFERLDPFYRNAIATDTGPGAVTSLPIQLFGIRINEGAGTGSAIIAGTDGVQNSIGVGEEIQPGVRLTGVHFDHVEIDNAGKKELLYLDQSQAPQPGQTPAAAPATQPAPPPTPAPITPSNIQAGVNFIPRTEGSRVTGIAVRSQGDGATFQAAGFRPGDVIRSVNGRAITAPSDITALSSQLRPGARLSLEIERGAGTVPVALTIPAGNP